MDGPRICHAEWNKSEGEKEMPYANTYIYIECKWKKKKNVLKNLVSGQEKRRRHREWTWGHREGEG